MAGGVSAEWRREGEQRKGKEVEGGEGRENKGKARKWREERMQEKIRMNEREGWREQETGEQ